MYNTLFHENKPTYQSNTRRSIAPQPVELSQLIRCIFYMSLTSCDINI